jgi:peptidyl-prolyl cis-trans isomerase SurA
MKIVGGLLLALLFMATSASAGSPIMLDKIVAVVNGEAITWSELYKAMELDASSQFKGLDAGEKSRIMKENESVFLDNLINVRLQLQEARNEGFSASDAEVKDAITSIMNKYSMDEAALKESLKHEGLSYDDYRKRLREQIIISKVVGQQVRNKVVVTDEDVRRFLEQDGDQIDREEGFKIGQIFFRMPTDDADKASIEARAREVEQKYRDGVPFAELARTYSEGPMAKNGGDLGFVKKKSLMREFASVLSSMKQGDVSQPFWTDRGLHIIELREIVSAKSQQQVIEEAKYILDEKMVDAKYSAWLKSLREKSFIEIKL